MGKVRTKVDFEDYLDAEVMDDDENVVGSLNCFWADEEETPIFLGITTSWNSERTLVVPVAVAETDEYHSCVLLQVSRKQLETAPTLPCDEPLGPELEERVYAHFDISAPETRLRLQINKAAAARGLHPSTGH